jgi:hypothetical protein
MTRVARLLLVLSAAASISAFAAAEISPLDFAYGIPIVTPGDAAVYRLALPPEVYQKAVRPDLGDLQVFNARGEPVPYAIEQPLPPRSARPPGRPLPLFALRDDSPAALNAMRVTIASQGSHVSVQTRGSDSTSTPAMSYVLDGQALDAAIAAIQVHWPEDAADYAGKMRIEAGNSLGSWHTVLEAAPIANLHSAGAQLIEDRVEIPATRAKFWRLSWVGTPPPFELTSAAAEPAAEGDTGDRSSLIVSGTPVTGRPGEFQFDLGARPPVDRINLDLPELNSVVEAELMSRASQADPWHRVTESGFYRLQGADGELRNGPIGIGVCADRFWLVRVPPSSSALGHGVLRIEAQWRAPDVVFLARGSAPFTLAYGSGSAIGAATPLAALPVTLTPVRATHGAATVLGGDARRDSSVAFPWRKSVLWGILAFAVALLAAMAYRLMKELNR